MTHDHETEIRDNFEFFQSIVSGLMPRHEGEYALLHHKAIINVFTKPIEAVEAGFKEFSDGLFSVQRVIDRPLDLGFMSYGSSDRPTDRR